MANASKLRKEIRAAAPDLVERIDRLTHEWLSPLLERLDSGDIIFRTKLVNDPIWGAIELSPWEVALLDTDMLQRMRGVRQLGLAQLVFPGAGHGRLEHIIGVIGAVETMLDALAQQIKRRNRDAEANGHSLLPEIKDSDRLALRLAALFHDLGHGPFSHALEPVMRPQAVLRADDETGGWREELKTLTGVFKNRYQFNEEPAESEVIAALIVLSDAVSKVLAHGELRLPADVSPAELQMRIVACIVGAVEGDYADHLSAVISGQIDADKLDYLQRDAHHAGLEIGFDTDRLLARLEILQVRPDNIDASVGELRTRVVKAPHTTLLQLGIAASGFGSFEQMLIGRTFLYDRLYHHHKVRAAEAMAQRLILVAERDRTQRFAFEDLFVNMGDEVILRVFAGDVELPGFEPISDPARQLAKGILKRDLLHRAFALRGRFIGVGAGLNSEQADQRRRKLWGRLVDDLNSLKRRYEIGEKIHALALDCCDALAKAGVTEPDLDALRARLEACGPEQIIVDLPALKASAIRILARYPNGALRIPEFSFNPVKWSNAYELQKRTTYVFAPRDVLPMVALASKIVFFGEYGVTMAAEADGFIKASDLPLAWVPALVEAGIIDETARTYLTETRRSLTLIDAADLKAPEAWLNLDEDFALVLTRELNKALTGGIALEHLDALGHVLEAMWRLVDTWHDKGLLTETFADERALQDKVKSLLGMTSIKVQEGLETSGGETDLLLEELIILENKIHGVTRSPETAAAAAGQQGRRYGIALNSRIVLVVLAYQVPKDEKVKNKVDAVSVHPISGEDGRQVEIRFTLPYGATTPSLEKADRSVRPTATKANPRTKAKD